MNTKFIQSTQYRFILILFSLVLLIGLVFYVQNSSTLLTRIKSISPTFVVLLLSLQFFQFIFLGLTHKWPLLKHRIHLNFKEWFGLCVSSELFNIFLPAKAGSAIRMTFLKSHHRFSMRAFLTMGFAVTITSFTLLGIIGSTYCHFFLLKKGIIFNALESICISLSLSGILLIFMTETFCKIFKINRKISPKFYLSDKNLILKCTLSYFLIFLLYPLRIYLSFKALGVPVKFNDSFEIGLILIVISMFEILPGNIGIKELAIAYIAEQFGISFEVALLVGILDRALSFIFLVPLGTYFYLSLFKINLNLPIKKILVKE